MGPIGAAFAAISWSTVAINVALTAALYVLTPKPKAYRSSGKNRYSQTASIDPWTCIYGEARVGGTVVYQEYTGSQKQWFHTVIALAGHECEGIGLLYFNDEAIALDGATVYDDGEGTGKYAGKLWVWKHLGTSPQLADTNLVAESAGNWTTAHRLEGRTYVHMKLLNDPELFPDGLPKISFDMKGSNQVYDPRDDTAKYTTNAALCSADYIYRDDIGLASGAISGGVYTRIHDADLIAAANVSDETVAVEGGGTEARYTVNGAFTTEDRPEDVLGFLVGAMAGKAVWAEGQWHLYAGEYRSPTVTITADDLAGPVSIQPRVSRRDLANTVRGTYIDSRRGFLPVDYPPVIDDTLKTADGGELLRRLDLPFTTSKATAQRIALATLRETRQQIIANLECHLTVLGVRAPDVVLLDLDRYGWSDKPFEVIDSAIAQREDEKGQPILVVLLTVKETTSTIWDWSESDDQTDDPAPDSGLPGLFDVAAPTGFTATAESNSRVLQDGIAVPRVSLSWTAADEPKLGWYEVQWETDGGSDGWSESIRIPRGTTAYVLEGPGLATDINVRIRSVTALGTVSSWATDTVTVTGSTSNYTGLIRNRPSSAFVRAYASSRFSESFDDDPTVDWPDASGNAATVTNPTGATPVMGGRVLQVAGDEWRGVWTDPIPFDPTKMYRLRARVRKTAAASSGGEGLYIGLLGVGADGSTFVNTSGGTLPASQHWVLAENFDMGGATLDEWIEVTAWIVGTDTSGDTKTSGGVAASSPTDPAVMHEDVRYILPAIWVNRAGGDGTVQVDFVTIDVLDETASDRVYGTIASRGRLIRGSRMATDQDQDVPIVRGQRRYIVRDGDTISFDPQFDTQPTFDYIARCLTYSNALSGPQKLIVRAVGLTTSGCTISARISETTGATTTRSTSLSGSPLTGTKSETPEAVDLTYIFEFDVALQSAIELGGDVYPATVTLGFYAKPSGGSFTKYGEATYDNSNTGSSKTYTDRQVPITVAGLGASAEFKIEVEISFRFTSVSNADVSWEEGTAPSDATATPDMDTVIEAIFTEAA